MKKIIILLAIFASACICLVCGCKEKDHDKNNPPADAAIVNIIDSALTLDCFETYALETETKNVNSIVWESSDFSVVSVDENGNLAAGVKLGTATVTARCGDVSDSCEVTVLLKSGLPEMRVENKAYVSEGGSYSVACNVYYNSKDISEYLTFGCDASDDNNGDIATASVKGNIVTFEGVTAGETTFSIYTTVFGRLYAEKITIRVSNTDVVYVVDGLVNNYLQIRPDTERYTSDVAVYYQGKRVPDNQLEWNVSDDRVFSIGENGRLIGKKEGFATLSTTYRDKLISVEVSMVKDREYVAVEQTSPFDFNLDMQITVDTSSKTRTYAVNEEIINTLRVGEATDEGIVVRAAVDGESLGVNDFVFSKGVVNIPAKSFGSNAYGEKSLTIEVEDTDVVRVYTLKVLLITKIPRTLKDLKDCITIQWPGDRILGYFVLESDIDFSFYTISVWATDWNWDNGFRGTLDGRGHALQNVKADMYGLTAQMGEGAVLKNLKFRNVKYNGLTADGKYGSTLFAKGAVGCIFENIEITLSEDSTCAFNENSNIECGLLVSVDMRRCTFKNITINAQGKDLQKVFGGKGNEVGSSVYENVVINAKSVKYYENFDETIPKGVTLNTND